MNLTPHKLISRIKTENLAQVKTEEIAYYNFREAVAEPKIL